MVTAFYASLHGVQALLLRDRRQTPESHTERNRALNSYGHDHRLGSDKQRQIRTLGSQYTALRIASIHARYEPWVTCYSTIEAVQTQVIDRLFTPIERTLRDLIGPQTVGKLPPIVLAPDDSPPPSAAV